MAGPAEDQDEFTAYREQRRGAGQSQQPEAVDEFAEYQAKRGRKKKDPNRVKMGILDAAKVTQRQGIEWGLADEATGVRRMGGLPEWADQIIEKTPFGAAQNVGMGLGALFMENQTEAKGGKLPEAYTQGRDTVRADVAQARQDRPVTSFFSELSGAAGYPAGALKMGAPIVGQTLKLGTIGAGQGAVYGYSASDGDTADRTQGAQIGGAFGAAGGAILPGGAAVTLPVFRAGKTGVAEFADWLVGRFGGTGTAVDANAKQVAIAAVRRSMERSKMTPQQIMDALEKFGDKPAVLAEVIGQDAVNSLTALTRRPGSTPQKAQAIIEERFGGFVDRAQTDLEKATGFKRGDIAAERDAAIVERRDAAAPVYDQAYSQFPEVASQRLAQIAQDSPVLQDAMSAAQKALANEAAAKGKPVAEMSQLQFWDLVKRQLDQAETAAKAKPGGAEKVRAIEIIRKPLVDELDAVTSGAYAAAREVGGEAPRLQSAFQQGSQALGSRPASEIQAQVNALNPQDAPFFKAGMVSDIANKVDKGMGPNRFRVRDTQNKLRAGLGEEEGGSFLNAMEAEASLRETGSRWAPRMNSVTGNVLESGPSQAVDDAISGATALLRGDKIGALRTLVNVMRRRGYNPKQIDAMGDLLLSDPMEGLRQLGVQLPQGFTPGGGAAASIGQGFEPASRVPANALSGVRGNEAGTMPSGAGLGPNTQNALAGGFLGGAGGSAQDLNGDGVRDWKDAAIGAAGGVALGGVAGKVGGTADNAASMGAGGRKPPQPDSPEAIAAQVRKLATRKAPEPSRLERMVEERKGASVPPAKVAQGETEALGAQAERMAARGLTPIEIYDQTGVAMVNYNGGNVPIISATMGPEELTRKFYQWLAKPADKRPEWVKEIIARAPKKKGLMLRDVAPAPPQANALEPPMPPAGIPYGAIAGGAALGAATGIPAGALIGYGLTREERPRNALAGQ
jgi:hypothetical protein